MIPVSISMEGFLPYRQYQALDFKDANLWMLSGRNGAGKSSVFDAITFALYGDGRYGDGGGIQQDYISHGETKATVTFDFDIGEKRYRIKRSLTLNGSPSFDAFEVDRKTDAFKSLASGVSKGKTWVENTLGLNSETFSAAVMLRQGSSDALLSAKDTPRREMMNQIINLGAYEKMQEMVNDQAKTLRADVRALENQITKQETDSHSLASKIVTDFALEATQYPLGETWLDTANRLLSVLHHIETEAGREAERLTMRETALLKMETYRKTWETHTQSRADLLWKRAAYDAILSRHAEIEHCASRLKEITLTIPPRNDWRGARTKWLAAEEKRQTAENAFTALQKHLNTLEQAKEQEQTRFDAAKTVQDKAMATLATAKEHLKTLLEREKQLNATHDKPTCMVCGKPLTAGEVEAELATLKPEIATAKDNAAIAAKSLDDAQDKVTASEKEIKCLETKIKQAERGIATEEQKIALAMKDREQAETSAQAALTALRKARQELSEISVQDSPFTAEDIADRICPPSGSSTPLADCLRDLNSPDEQEMESARSEQARLQGADKELERLKAALKDVTSIDGGLNQVEADLVTDNANIQSIAAEQNITDLLQSKAEAVTAIEAEISGYAALAVLLDAVARDKNKAASDKRIKAAFAAFAQAVTNAHLDCVKARKQAERRRDNARDNRTDLAHKLADYADTAEKLRVTRQEALVYRTLETKLDGRNLQSYLRTQAEKAIVANANTVLQRLSDSMLCLELLTDTPRALDLRVIDREKNGRAMPTAGLSGSQKFRVSVALAVGIGQYACGMRQGGVESVIIDEGFGSLDKEGRDKMIDELYGLEKILKRVIVVSHQEEFQAAFPNQWQIYMDGDTARARMQTG